LDRRARTLSLSHHADDLGQQGVGANLFGTHQQTARTIDGRADQPFTRSFLDRNGFTSHHGFVDRTTAVEYRAIHGHLFPRPHP
jgi:hypothetical protein